MLRIRLHIVPSLNVSGDWVSSVHISANLSFQPANALSKLLTIQLSLKIAPPSLGEMRLTVRRISPDNWLLGLYRADGGQDFLGKGYHKPTEQAQEPLCPLAGIVGLDGHTYLHDAPA